MSDKAAQRAANKVMREDKARLDKAVKAMMQHADTRFYLNWLLEIGKVGVQPFTNNALTTSFLCGEYNVGLQIFQHILEVDTAGYVQMRQEIEDERNTRRSRRTNGDTSYTDTTDDAYGEPLDPAGDDA